MVGYGQGLNAGRRFCSSRAVKLKAHNIWHGLDKVLEGDSAVVCDAQVCQHSDAVGLEAA